MTETSCRTSDQGLYDNAEDAFTSEGGALSQPAQRAAAAVPAPSGEREALMAEFSIAYNGRHYEYDRYRYDHLSDAVHYARLQRAKPAGTNAVGPRPSPEQVEVPTESERQLMATLAVTFEHGVYRLGAFRYERLADAVDYARRTGQRPLPL